MTQKSHPIDVDLEQILPILAREIYTSPFAFLRENMQNAFDAIRMQLYRDKNRGITCEHRININLDGNRLSILDTGIGMTKEDLSSYFWSIGKSGKHTEEAKSAGVVGTFGIGGMANFGVCSRLDVITRTYEAEAASVSFAERSKLSARDDCVFYEAGPSEFRPGTQVVGTLLQSISEDEIRAYLEPIVQYIDVPIYLGETAALTKKEFPSVKRDVGTSSVVSNGPVTATVYIRALKNGQAQIEIEALTWDGKPTEITGVFDTTFGVVSAYQHGFMLSNVPVSTVFGLGGVLDSPVLRPTAGREAVTDASRSLIQHLLGAVENGLAEHISRTSGLPERFSSFYKYLSQHGRWDLAGAATVRVCGRNHRVRLDSMKDSGKGTVFFARDGHDQSIIQAYSEQQKIVVLLSTDGHRQKTERNYLTSYCNASVLEDRVTCLRIVDKLSFAEMALKYQLHDRLRQQFLIDNLYVCAGELSHGAMLWVPQQKQKEKKLFIDFRHAQIARLVQLRESLSFDAVFDIFIRDSVLPHLESAFPELRKRDFDALLRKLQSTVEYFEIDPSDIGRIQQLASITRMTPEDIATVFGGRRSRIPKPTSVRRSDVATVTKEVDQVVEQAGGKPFDEILQELEIRLLETEINAKILDTTEVQSQLGLSRYYLALTRDAHLLYRRIFLERRPTTDFSWGGHRVGYLFYSEGSVVVYYDIQFKNLIDDTEGHLRTGTFTLEKKPLVLKNQVFLPIPDMFENEMVPTDTVLKFTIRHQILGVTETEYNSDTPK